MSCFTGAKVVGRVAPDVTLISTASPIETAAKLVSDALNASEMKRLGLAGGSVVKAIAGIRKTVDFRTVKLTWVDERVVMHGNAESNCGEAYRSGALYGSLGFTLPLVLDGETAQQAVTRLSPIFSAEFAGGLDAALLGMGEDGHVASLFPKHRLLDEREAGFAWLDDSPKPPATRVTMTKRVLANASLTRVVLATGAGKRDALQKLIDGDGELPIAQLGPLTVVTDQHFTKTGV